MAAAGSRSPGPEEHYTCADKHAVDHKLTPECAERCGVRESNRCWVCGFLSPVLQCKRGIKDSRGY